MKIRVYVWALFAVILFSLTAESGFAQSAGFTRNRPAGNQTYRIEFRTNVNGASVTINGQYQGTAPLAISLQPGYYQIVVSANGYRDYTTNVQLNGNTIVNAVLQAANYSLTVTSNVNGATVYLNGRQMGQTPMTASLQPGTYNLRVEASGYEPYRTQVTVNQSTSINAQLRGSLARIHIRIPEHFLNVNSDFAHGERRRAMNDVRVFVNNRRMERDNFELQQGNYTIRFESGSFMVQQNFYFQAGRDYTLSPELSIRVN